MVNLDSICFQYNATSIFENFSWEVKKGETWAILGPSGCGKSTLLSIIAGLRFPKSGNVIINNQPIYRPRPQTGLILQDYGLLPWATVRQNANLGLTIRSFYGADGIHAPHQVNYQSEEIDWVERLGLSPIADKFPSQISGGQRQRVAIARTLALHPDLLLMDEPFSSLDAPTRESLQQLTFDLISDQGFTLILVTHSIEEAALLGQNILLLSNPPNVHPQMIENTHLDIAAYRDSTAYSSLCKKLRLQMDEN